MNNYARNYSSFFKVGPYVPTDLGGLNTLATPINILIRFLRDAEMPAQVLESFKNLGSLVILGTADMFTAYKYRAQGYATGDEEAIKKSDELMKRNFEDSLDRGEEYFTQYYVTAQWLFSLLDHSETANRQGYTTYSANWFRVLAQEIMIKTGNVPEWLDDYDPIKKEYNLFEKITQTIFRTHGTRPEEEKGKPVVPYTF